MLLKSVAFKVHKEYDSNVLPASNQIPTKEDTQLSGKNNPYKCSGKEALNICSSMKKNTKYKKPPIDFSRNFAQFQFLSRRIF